MLKACKGINKHESKHKHLSRLTASAFIAGKYVNPLSGFVFPPGAEIISKSDEGEIYGSAGMRAEGIDEKEEVNGLYKVASTLHSDVPFIHILLP